MSVPQPVDLLKSSQLNTFLAILRGIIENPGALKATELTALNAQLLVLPILEGWQQYKANPNDDNEGKTFLGEALREQYDALPEDIYQQATAKPVKFYFIHACCLLGLNFTNISWLQVGFDLPHPDPA